MSIKRKEALQSVSQGGKIKAVWKQVRHSKQLYLMILPAVIYYVLFVYMPMYGVQIAFRDYTARGGLANSNWVGLKHFINFLTSVQCWKLIKNTATLSLMSMFLAFPFPIILAILFNEAK